MLKDVQKEAQSKMDHSLELLADDLAAVRTGRANPGLLNHLSVEYYGTPTPLNQVANIAAPDPQMLTVTPYDPSIVKAVERTITASDLGLNPSVEGGMIRVPIPALNEERRRELVKHVKKMGEDCKVAIRNIRRDANDKIKKLEKSKEITQDEEHQAQTQIQTVTDNHTKTIDEMVAAKEADLMTI